MAEEERWPDGWDDALEELLGDLPEVIPEEETQPKVAVLVAGIADPQVYAALLKGPKVAARCVAEAGVGMALLDDAEESAALDSAARASAMLRGLQMILVRRGPSDDPAAGDMQAYLYIDGEQSDTVSPGLLLANSPQLLEDLLLDPEAAAPVLAKGVYTEDLSVADAMGAITRRGGRKRRGRGNNA
jgi:hypothetical protein